MIEPFKPLGGKAYGHIPRLPGSRMGPGDHRIGDGQARILTEKVRDRHDRVFVEEKLDGSCVSVARVDGELVALTRAGYLASTSMYPQHAMWGRWFEWNRARFESVLPRDGERVVGEWLAQAHGTRYDLAGRDPFVAFDIMSGITRVTRDEFHDRVFGTFAIPKLLALEPTSIEAVMASIGHGHYGAREPVEGAVWRVERRGVVDFLAKFVRPDKVDGAYLESVTGGDAVWNWSDL